MENKRNITIRQAEQNDIPAIKRLIEYLMRVEEAEDSEFHRKNQKEFHEKLGYEFFGYVLRKEI